MTDYASQIVGFLWWQDTSWNLKHELIILIWQQWDTTTIRFPIDPPDAVVVEVVEDGQAILVALPVVRLCSSSTEKIME